MLYLPLFYFPSTLVLVDDDLSILNITADYFKAQGNFLTKKFVDPLDACLFFDHYVAPLSEISFFKAIEHDEYYERPDHSPVDFNVLNIPLLRENLKRFFEVSIILTDIGMPKMNGIEFCQKMEHVQSKKILLTAERNLEVVINAFNDHIVDKFIVKTDNHVMEEVGESVRKLSRKYFFEKTESILAHLESERKLALSDTVFINYFDQWCNKNNIKEYYLFDKNGSFLCVNNNDEIIYFVVNTDRTLENSEEIYESQGISDLYEAIKSRKKISFFDIGKEAKDFKNKNWHDYLYDFDVLEGREKYYLSVIKK